MPDGWKQRAITVGDPISTHGKIGLCLEVHDLAASKLAAYREKDKDFVRTLLIEKMIDAVILKKRIDSLDVEKGLRERLIYWVSITDDELKAS